MPGDQIGSAYVTLSLDDSKLESGLNAAKGKVSSAVGGMGSAIGSALKTGAVAGAAALAGIATVGVKTFMDVESAAADAASKMDLSAIAQKSGKTTEEAFKSVKEHVMSLSDQLGQLNTNAFDPTQIAEACANLAAGGFDIASASAKDLSGILAMATGTNYDLGSSAEMAMATMNQFGLGVTDLSHISDVYTKACGDSAAGMEDLNYAMQYAGPVAKGVGVSLEEVTANLEVFANNGIKGEKAGTALADAMNTLVAPSGASAKGIAALGLSVADVDPRTHDFNDTLKDLKARADASGQGMAAFVDIFGVRGGLLYGLAGATDEVDKFENSLKNCDGAAESMAKNMLDNLKGSLDAAMGAASSLAYMIGGKLEPSIRSALDWFSSKGAPAIREFITAVSEGDWQGAGALIEKGIRAGFEKLKDLGERLLEWLKGVDYGAIADYITDKIKAGWESLKDLGNQLLEWLKGVDWASVGSAIWDGIVYIKEKWIDFWEGLRKAVLDVDWEKLAGDIADLIKAGWKKVKDWAADIIAGLKADWDAWIASDGPKMLGGNLAKAIAEGAKDAGKWIYNKIKSWWDSNGSSLGGAIAAAIDFAKSAAQAAWDFAKSFGSTLLTAGKGTIGAAILEVIGGAMNSAWDGAGDSLITRAKEWRDNAEALFAAEDFEAYVEYIGTGDNPYEVENLDIDLPIKYHISKSGDAFYVVSDENNAEHGTQRGQVFKSATTAAFAVENAAKALGISTKKLDDATQKAAETETKTAATITEKYKSTSEKANALTMGAFQTSTQALLAAAMQGAQATQQAATATSAAAAMAVDRILNGSQAAANAIKQGAQVAANFTTQAGQAVKIGLDASGREIAVIGQVAQQRFTQAGGELYNKVQVAGSGFQSSVQAGANAVNGAASNLAGAAASAASSLASAYASFASHNPYSGNSSLPATSQTIVFSSSGSSSHSSSSSGSSSSSSSNPSWWDAAYAAAGGRAMGTETTGPELAIIGEAGREWVIPEKHKRWDLLLAAMRAYGITGMAEGGAAGSSGATEATDADEMRAYFGIKGLASMSKQVQKIITDLKNFFRISWGIIKAEGSTYWRQINQIISQEATNTRDNAWQAAIDIRNTWLSSNAQILADTKTSYEAIWPTISPSLESLRSSAVMTFEGINGDVANVMMGLSMNWSGVWDEMLLKLSDAQTQISAAVSEISTQLASISMNTSISITSSGGGGGSYSGGGGGGGGGAGGMDWGFAGSDDWLAPTGDWSEYGSSSISCGSNCNIGCEGVYNNAVISSTGPLATAGLGVDLMNAGYGGGSYGGGGYSGSFGTSSWGGLAPIFRARGALVDKGPELSIVGEAGPELILPANITRTIMALADMGLGSLSGGAGRVVIEDHTVHKWYMDGKEVTNLLMDKAVRQLRLKGASPVR